ncbi:MAG: hypothetical protein JRH15_01770 [Deltaproteobacteria bacterium]|nr:hypothetical protein [Deltaproteobacteria bacterium]
MTTSILSTKLTLPPQVPNLVPLPRLLAKLDEGYKRERSVSLVTAPAGFGKTTVVGVWLKKMEIPCSWLSLDDNDNILQRFLDYLVAALQRIEKKIGMTIQAAMEAPRLPPIQDLMTTLINDMSTLPDPFVLVLDDYQAVKNAAINDALQFLIDNQPHQLHLVLISREEPPLTLARFRAGGLITDIGMQDLRFTLKETETLMNETIDRQLSEKQIATLAERTEGWIAGLRLAAVSIKNEPNPDEFIRQFAGDHRYIIDYLTDEIFSKQTKERQMFLMKTAVLERFNAALCDAVVFDYENTGISYGILEYLDKTNLFVVPLDNRRHWYRYHSLFSDLLIHQLKLRLPQIIPELYIRAGHWFERNGYFEEAVRNFLKAPDYEAAARLIEQHAMDMFFKRGFWSPTEWFESLPEQLVTSHPVIDALHVYSLFWQGLSPLDQLKEKLTEIENRLNDNPIGENGLQAVGTARKMLSPLRILLERLRLRDPRKIIELIRGEMDGTEDTPISNFYRGVFFNLIGEAYLELGEGNRAWQAFDEASKVAREKQRLYIELDSLGLKVRVTRLQGNLSEAERECRNVLNATVMPAEKDRMLPASGPIYLNLGYILMERNELEAASLFIKKGLERIALTIDTAQKITGFGTFSQLQTLLGTNEKEIENSIENTEKGKKATRYSEAVRAQVRLLAGDIEATTRWSGLKKLDPSLEAPGLGIGDEFAYFNMIVIARTMVAHHRHGKDIDLTPVFELISNWKRVYREGGWIGRLLELLILESMAYDSRGSTEKSLQSLKKALSLASPEGYSRLFLNEGTQMKLLLLKAKTRNIVPEHVKTLLTAFLKDKSDADPKRQKSHPEIPEQLSRRELEVLRLIDRGLSNKEIAQELYISIGTVKVHLHNIYGKLDVSGRMKAVSISRELGLLSGEQ